MIKIHISIIKKLSMSNMRNINVILCLFLLISFNLELSCFSQSSTVLKDIDPSHWHGFNLLEKFALERNSPYVENDFKWISEFGFNFVRLPIDYRCYTDMENELQFIEAQLKEIDQALVFGKKYNIHVCINLHRAPGYCIHQKNGHNLWSNEKTQKIFIKHWLMFAKRYKSISSERLSFNLLNEPTHTTYKRYLNIINKTINAINKEDPNRLIIVDGMNIGSIPISELLFNRNVIQATRGYHPGSISHYNASWLKDRGNWIEPTWPLSPFVGFLYGPGKTKFNKPLLLNGELPINMKIGIKINSISKKAMLVAKADNQIISKKYIDPKNDSKKWNKIESKNNPNLSIYTVRKEFEYKVVLPNRTKEFTLENVLGDWLFFSKLIIDLPDNVHLEFDTDKSWGRKQIPLSFDSDKNSIQSSKIDLEKVVIDEYIEPWVEISSKGAKVIVGEWGCLNQTPHSVTIAWMKSWLEKYKKENFGWALWNFRGGFGILDSKRNDVIYEKWNGHNLDREMLTLLQNYSSGN